jgi:hypothetical protein
MEPKDINFAAMPRTAVSVVTKPAEFFKNMPKTGGFLEPLVFAIIMGFIGGIIQAVLNVVGLGAGGYGGGIMSRFGVIIFMPIIVAIGSFIGAALFFVIWKLMGSQENYETAYRCGAYLTALTPIAAIISVVPYVGVVVIVGIDLFYLVMASIYVHNLPSQKAWLVFGIIGVFFAIMGFSGEYKARHALPAIEQWREMGEKMRKDYQDQAKDMAKSTEEMRKKAEEMAKQFKAQADEARRQAEKNQ